jgi:hypothetical protein
LYWIWQKVHLSQASMIVGKVSYLSWNEKPRQPMRPEAMARDVIGRELFELLVQDEVEVGRALHLPHGHLGGEMDLGPPVAFQRPTHKALALALVVAVGGVDVVDPRVDRTVQHPRGERLVDAGAVAADHGQPHASEAEDGGLEAGLAENAVTHHASLSSESMLCGIAPDVTGGRRGRQPGAPPAGRRIWKQAPPEGAAAAAALLAAAYGFLYAALRSEDYSLLMGSIGLFVILAAAMLSTRKVDWYRLRRAGDAPGE